MRSSDWSSDVCSTDLGQLPRCGVALGNSGKFPGPFCSSDVSGMVHGVVARSARWRMGTGIAGGADAHIPVGMDDLAVSGGALPACYHAAPNGAYSQIGRAHV